MDINQQKENLHFGHHHYRRLQRRTETSCWCQKELKRGQTRPNKIQHHLVKPMVAPNIILRISLRALEKIHKKFAMKQWRK